MSPIDKVRKLYDRFPQPRTFAEDFEAHLQHGFVFSKPDCFLMARPVCKDAPHDFLADPWHQFDNPDCWLIWAAAGSSAVSVRTFCLTMQPFPLTWVAWARRTGPLKFHLINP
jgi:hypothetical protein